MSGVYFSLAKIKHKILKINVMGVAIYFSKLFTAKRFPMVFRANKMVIIHNSIEMILGEIFTFQNPAFTKTTAINIKFKTMENASNFSISSCVFNLPPQTF